MVRNNDPLSWLGGRTEFDHQPYLAGGHLVFFGGQTSSFPNKLGKLDIETFMSGPVPTVGRGDYEFSRLLGLNTWLSGVCKLKGLNFIDNFNIFWRQRDIFRRDGLHLNRLGEIF